MRSTRPTSFLPGPARSSSSSSSSSPSAAHGPAGSAAPGPAGPAARAARLRRLWRTGGLLLGLAAALPALPARPAFAVDWFQFDVDGRHNGNSQEEIIINTGNVATLHSLYHVTLSSSSTADGAPAFLSGVTTTGGIVDLLFLTTKDGHILALNAATGAQVWGKQPATGPNFTTSSPAVDPNRLYVYSYGLEGNVHKYQVADGTEVTTGGWPELATRKPSVEKVSPALSLIAADSGTAYLVVANGGYPGDAGDYQGHVTSIDLSTGAQNVFNTQCSDQTVHFFQSPNTPDCATGVQSAVWARPGVVYSSELDRIFLSTGNATYDANTGGHDWGGSVLALHPDGTGTGSNGQPVDSYTPTEFQQLQNNDADLGSTAPALLPAVPGSNVGPLAVQSGKDGLLRLLDLANLSGLGGPAHTGGELQKINVPQGGGVLTQPAVWVNPADGGIWVFVANGSGISGLTVTADGSGNPHLNPTWTKTPGGSSPIVANGMVFYAGSNHVTALDPTTGSQLFNDASIGGVHWESPIVVGGRLFVTDENKVLWAYGPTTAPLGFFTLAPCRVIDTRGANGPYGGPALQGNGARRLFQLAGQCGVPADAKAVALNVTVVQPASAGDFRVGPGGVAAVTSTLNFSAGQVRAGDTVAALTGDPLGSIWVQSDSAGAAHLLIDVAGYFK